MPDAAPWSKLCRMKRPANPSSVPRGGWRYADPLTGIPHKETDLTVLLQSIRKSRIANGHPIEAGWDRVVLDEMCRANENIDCRAEGEADSWVSGDALRRFVNTLIEQQDKAMVSEEEHRRRADICLTCPKIGPASCVPPCGWLTAKLTDLLAGRRLHRAAELHKRSCTVCKCNLDSKTYYALDALRAVDAKLGVDPGEYWSGCWMR